MTDYEDYETTNSNSSPSHEEKIEKGEKTVRIRELDLNTLYPHHAKDFKNGSKYVIIGKPGTGKSTLIESILYAKRSIFATIKTFSGTEDSNGFFGSKQPAITIEDGLDLNNLEAMENFKKRQKYAKKYIEPSGGNPWCAIVHDDCSSDNKLFKKTIFQELYKNGRHWRMMHLLSLQYSLDIPPAIRACIDGVFILRESNPAMRKKLFENYGNCVNSFSEWNDLMDQLTDNYTAMFIDNKTQSNSLEDCIFYYKADPSRIPKDWKLGCREFWDFHNERYQAPSAV
jgi:hypothetical protein